MLDNIKLVENYLQGVYQIQRFHWSVLCTTMNDVTVLDCKVVGLNQAKKILQDKLISSESFIIQRCLNSPIVIAESLKMFKIDISIPALLVLMEKIPGRLLLLHRCHHNVTFDTE